jgi:hypothetical protein
MSLSRMTREERASYFIGQAVLRQLEQAPRDPDTMREIDAVSLWIEHWLTPEEYVHVLATTGYDFAGDFSEDNVTPASEPPSSSEDDMPF